MISGLLYILYTSDTPQPLHPSIQLAQYANDTAYWSTHTQLAAAKNHIERQLRTFLQWTRKWRITINVEKTQAIIFRKKIKEKHRNASIKFNNTTIPVKTRIKYLGIVMHRKLTVNIHYKEMLRKARPIHGTLKHLANLNRKGLSLKILKQIYIALIRPHLTYAAVATMPLIDEPMINRIRAFERKCLRTAYKLLPNYRNNHLHQLTKTHPIDRHIANLMLNYIHNAHTREYRRRLINTAQKMKKQPEDQQSKNPPLLTLIQIYDNKQAAEQQELQQYLQKLVKI